MAGLLVTDVSPVEVAQQDRSAGADIGGRRRVNGRNGTHEHDAQHERRQELIHQCGNHGGIVQVLEGFVSGQLEDFGAHPLKSGEEEQGEADHEGGHEGLLPGQGFGGFDAEGPHGERRGALDPHQGEHVSEDHDCRPGQFSLSPPETEIDHPGYFQELGI